MALSLADPNIAFLAFLAGLLGIYAGLCGRVLIGVAGAVLATVSLASLITHHDLAHLHWWTTLAAAPVLAVTILLWKTARKARKNKYVSDR